MQNNQDWKREINPKENVNTFLKFEEVLPTKKL